MVLIIRGQGLKGGHACSILRSPTATEKILHLNVLQNDLQQIYYLMELVLAETEKLTI